MSGNLSTPPTNIFPERLRSVREERKLSQADLAEKTGLQPSAISHFESNRRSPSFDNLRRLADALTVSTDYLLGRVTDVGSSGPIIQQMFRHAENLSEGDLQTLEGFAQMLAAKNKPKK